MAEEENKENKENENSEEYLRNYLDNKDFNENNDSEVQENIIDNKDNLGSTKDLEYIAVDINELPCGMFYPAGTTIMVRAAKVSEIQAFSMVDDTNFNDLYEKVTKMIESCVFLRLPDGNKAPYINLYDPDRWYIIFVIRELTFPKGTDLYVEVGETKIPLKRGYFEFHEIDEKVLKYFNKLKGRFIFPTKAGNIEMGPPTIGLSKSFTESIIKELQTKKEVNTSFLKVIPFTLPGRTSITQEGINKKLKEYENIDEGLFQFLNEATNLMTFGIKGVKSKSESGEEVRSDNIFPGGASKLFVRSDAFDDFIK